jgi:KDO2-lipid IV(A) lauroyltransferase
MKELRWYLETALFLAFSFAIALLPDRVAMPAGRGLGRLCYLLLKRRRRIAIDNISASLPYFERQTGWVTSSAKQLALGTFENLGISLVEDCKIYHGRGRQIIDAVQFRGVEHYREAVSKGKGVAFITGHCGNFELMSLSFGARFQKLSIVARRQDNRVLNGVLEKIRKGYRNIVIYKSGALRSMFVAFKKGEVVGLLIDQAVNPDEGVLVDFLGRPAWTSRMPALIARKSGVPLVPVFIHREGALHVVTMYPEIQLSQDDDLKSGGGADAARIAGVIERYIVAHPEQWYWVHNRWKRAPAVGALPASKG